MKIRSALIACVVALSSCSGPTLDALVEPDDIPGEEWPFTIPSFQVDCTNGLDVYAVHDGVAYPLRGGGQSAEGPAGAEVRDLKDIWKLNAALQHLSPGVRQPMELTRREALSRCVEAGQAQFTEF